MAGTAKTEQLQIRVSKAQKSALQRAAARAGVDVSAYVLARAMPPAAAEFSRLTREAGEGEGRFALAELNALLTRLSVPELREAVSDARPRFTSDYLANTVAAMVETACAKRAVQVPAWTREIVPLSEPAFGSTLQALRLYLLTNSPAAFRRRNIFIDATIDDQV